MFNNSIRENKVLRIDSKMYYEMYKLGGSILVATYAELKAFRNLEERYVPIKHKSNNKVSTGYSLLVKCTGISRQTLEKYVPMLESLQFCHFDASNGALHLDGYNKTKLSNNNKLVPIKIGRNLKETELFVDSVILKANLDAQGKEIEKKVTLTEKIRLYNSKDGFLTTKDCKKIQKLKLPRKKGKIDASGLNMVKTLILSNNRIATLLNKGDSKASGQYLKTKFKSAGIITTKRRFKDVLGRMITFEEYKVQKLVMLRAGIDSSRFTFRNRRMVEELASEILFTNNGILPSTSSIVSLTIASAIRPNLNFLADPKLV
jgi:hypothetical protein